MARKYTSANQSLTLRRAAIRRYKRPTYVRRFTGRVLDRGFLRRARKPIKTYKYGSKGYIRRFSRGNR